MMAKRKRRGCWQSFCCLTTLAIMALQAEGANATDEIQVYNAGIAAPGQFTIEQHLNYVPLGVKDAPFPGGIISNNSINGTPEFAYGVTDWWELGLYLPFSIKDQTFYSDAFKVRTLFVSPHADQRNFFYGVNFEFSDETPPFAQTRFAMEIRPIIGIRNSDYEFIVNPIIDTSFGKFGETDFAPALRLARKFGTDLYAGFEYYSDFGKIGDFKAFDEQQHTLFAVTDFKLGVLDVDFGVGYGLTPASDRWVVKAILGYAFPVSAGGSPSDDRSTAGPLNPMSHSSVRMQSFTPQ